MVVADDVIDIGHYDLRRKEVAHRVHMTAEVEKLPEFSVGDCAVLKEVDDKAVVEPFGNLAHSNSVLQG